MPDITPTYSSDVGSNPAEKSHSPLLRIRIYHPIGELPSFDNSSGLKSVGRMIVFETGLKASYLIVISSIKV